MEQFPTEPFGKMLMFLGAIIFLLGLLLALAGKIPYLGQLPGDIVIRKKNFTFYFPLTTIILLNLILILISYLFRK